MRLTSYKSPECLSELLLVVGRADSGQSPRRIKSFRGTASNPSRVIIHCVAGRAQGRSSGWPVHRVIIVHFACVKSVRLI